MPGFYTAIQLGLSAWGRNPDADNVHHGLLLPNLLHIRDDGTVRCSERNKAVSRPGLSNAHSRRPAAADLVSMLDGDLPRTRVTVDVALLGPACKASDMQSSRRVWFPTM